MIDYFRLPILLDCNFKRNFCVGLLHCIYDLRNIHCWRFMGDVPMLGVKYKYLNILL